MFFLGDADPAEGPEATPGLPPNRQTDEFDRSPFAIAKEMVSGGIGLPWNLVVSGLIGIWLLFTRLTLGSTGSMANSDHVIGFLVLTTLSVAAAEVTRPVRYLNILFGGALAAAPFIFEAGAAATINGLACGLALIVLSFRRGEIRHAYGDWNRLIV